MEQNSQLSRMRIDFERLCRERGIDTAQPGERHYRAGWVCLPCPFCSGQQGNHLGFNPESNVFTCFRCGRHGKFETIAALLGTDKKEAIHVAKEYALDVWAENDSIPKTQKFAALDTPKELERTGNLRDFKVPGTRKLLPRHSQYLEKRGYDPERILRDWNIRCTGISGFYAYRIIIPVTYRGEEVSFTGRDITGEAADRYLACSPTDAIRHHKFCLYGADQSPYKTTVVVEGNFGVWRIGIGATGTLGTGWTHEQAKLIARFSKSYIFFDPEEREAGERAEKLQIMLSAYNCHKSFVIEGENAHGRDTGELTPSEVKEVRKLLK